jgi:beta-1,4-N-acetylglucosaminyltransferase
MMKVLVVCSQGGHLTEMMELLSAFEGHQIAFASYTSSRLPELEALAPTYHRSFRGVDPISAFLYFVFAFKVLLKEKPDVIVSNGAEIAIPFFYLGKLYGSRLIYVEVTSSVDKPTKTGRIVYPICDRFLVQWPELAAKVGKKARYEGTII